jgi:hypothetical protein
VSLHLDRLASAVKSFLNGIACAEAAREIGRGNAEGTLAILVKYTCPYDGGVR